MTKGERHLVPSPEGRRRMDTVNNRPIAPCRIRSMSSMLSAAAIMPATGAGTSNPAVERQRR